ncbi:disease resistance protein At4g27190-like [Trifolium pratense]|uniref:disease resistance protein At4g27190-like n=1 Tax=Trifolium pratense TaxID=57577 RepID=UPI001E696080|nr:disease resistance protein At4g27190-like [Trifolium pratense]XP_045792995.1 disease resistance protein At4g27190-like [Trifolium pratense]
MDAIISIVGSVVPYVFAPIRREVGYLTHYERNFTKLNDSVRNLEASREDINRRVESEGNNGKKKLVGVETWLEDGNEVIQKAKQLLEDPGHREVGCSGWSFPNLKLRHQLGKKATKIANEVAVVQGRSDFNEVCYLPALYEIASSSATCVGEKFETRELFKEGILKALKDPKACNIGVYGFGGVGKSFLVKEVSEIAKQQKLFDVVVTAHVSKTPDIEKIQVVIADMLGLTFPEESTDGRAIRLRKRIEEEKTVLVILDDIWQPLELEKVGIPSNKEHIGCKLLMTSRTQDVLQQMAVQKDLITFRLEVLSEVETWSLFQSMAEDVVNDIIFKDVATQIAKQCKGLPLLILTMASGLKSKDIYAWKDALSKLQNVGHEKIDVITHSALELSYNWLATDETKALFLLSAVLGQYGEDYLLKVAMGLEIFNNISTVDAARNRLHTIIGSLKASCLLLEGNKRSRRIQMHDLVRDVGISIACRNKDVYILKPETGLKEYLTMDFMKMCSQIILLQINELPKKFDCPNVKLLVFESANRFLEIPDTIFDGMGSLKVLDITLLNLSSLPTSFRSLTDLQTLCLNQCVLENIDIIGDLKNLEILSLEDSSMIKLPNKIREMTQLRMLDLSNAGIEIIPPNIISSLSNLEELYMGNTSITWEDENSQQKENASLAELGQLYNLTALELQIHEACILPRDLKLMFEKLQRYKIAIGDVWQWSDIKDRTSNTLMLKLDTNIHLELGIKALIKGVENLYMDEVDGIQNVLYEMNREGFPLLRHLHIQNNAKMKHIVYSTERNQVHVSFPILETLSINNLENLEQICHGPLVINSFGKLSVIKVNNCAQLTYLLSLSMVKSLSNLSEIEVCQCNSMKNIVLRDLPDEKVEFPSLRSLTLQHLDTLDNFFSYELMTSSITSARPFVSAQVAFPDLTTLKLSSLNLDKIWNDNQHSMYNLSVLIVENCGELKYLFSSTMVETFVNLKRVEISKCNSMNEIIATEWRNDVTIALNEVPFPKLKTIVLKDMENLKTVWHYQFDTVKTLEVENCEKIVVVFPSSMQKTYHNLEMLVVKDCALVELIFELSSSENSSIESETQLKVINLAQLPKLKKIWSIDPEGILSFHNLQKVDLSKCESMEYVFPFSVATGCRHLKQLQIEYCGKMKEIVSEKTGSTCASPTFEFNKLNTIVLWGLHSLEGFYAESHILACPSLNKIDVYRCAKLNLYKTVALPASIPQRCQDENPSDIFQPLFIVEEVIPNLEWMTINDRDAMVILKSQNLDSLFNKLTSLGLYDFKNEEATYPYWFLQNARSLEHLAVADSSFKKIFEDERLVTMKIHTRLKKLWLIQLPKLQHICEDGSLIHPLLEHLDSLLILDCPSLTNLLPSSVTFSHLTKMKITKCNKLVNLITSSTAQSLVKLTLLKVEDCDSLQEIITGKENVDIAFVSLQRLMLKGLPSLNNFCSSKCFLKFPLLEYVVVSNCPVMEIFSEGNTSTPSLRKVKIEENGEECYWKGNLNDTIKKDV